MVSLYQYERITELTVFLSQAEAQVWEEDSVTLTAQAAVLLPGPGDLVHQRRQCSHSG